MSAFIFYLFGLIAVASAIAFVTRRSPVAAALWLVNTMFCLAAMYVMLDAQFIGAIQVLVYAGAIMVVFLFVIMLLNLGQPSELADARGMGGKLIAGLLGLGLLAQLLAVAAPRIPDAFRVAAAESPAAVAAASGAVVPVARPLFTEHLLAFELTSVLLLAAIVGAVLLGRVRRD
jgi:NADH-quinone oxidoreductase subunit J